MSRSRPVVLVAGIALALTAAACAGTGPATSSGSSAADPTTDPTSEAVAEAAEIEVTHAQGTTTVPVNPETIVTFDIATLDTLNALGISVAGAPVDYIPERLAEAGEGVANVGDLFEPDFEAVNELAPDLIIVAGRSAAQLEPLSEIAPTIDLSSDWTDFRGSIEANATTLGEIFGQQDEVAALLADLDTRFTEVGAQAANAGNALIVLTSAGEVTAYGPGSRFGWLHDDLGLTPAVPDVEEATHGEAISFEFIAETNPDWLFVIDRDAATGESTGAAQQVLDTPLVQGTTAWQEGQVVYVDPVNWYIVNGGIPALAAMVDEVGAAFDGAGVTE